MTLLEKICKELGVEVGEEWVGTDNGLYKFDNHGNLLKYYKQHNNWYKEQYLASKIISGELKPMWKPKKGYRYYIPHIRKNDMERYRWNDWLETEDDVWYFENNLAFRTKEEAIEVANTILESLEGGDI